MSTRCACTTCWVKQYACYAGPNKTLLAREAVRRICTGCTAYTALLTVHPCLLPGLEAEQCLAIEDAPSGVEAAVAAGMRVVVVPSLRNHQAYPKPLPNAPSGVLLYLLCLCVCVCSVHHDICLHARMLCTVSILRAAAAHAVQFAFRCSHARLSAISHRRSTQPVFVCDLHSTHLILLVFENSSMCSKQAPVSHYKQDIVDASSVGRMDAQDTKPLNYHHPRDLRPATSFSQSYRYLVSSI